MATEVQRERLLILANNGKKNMKKIWLISFPEKIHAASSDLIPNCFSIDESTEDK